MPGESGEKTKTTISFLERVGGVVDGVFIFGDTRRGNIAKHIVDTLMSRPNAKGDLLRSCLTIVEELFPTHFRSKLRQGAFSNLPLDAPSDGGYRVLVKLGFGGENSVFLLKGGDKGRSYAVGIRRIGFENQEAAIGYARDQKQQYEVFKNIYSEMPDLVVEESFVVYSDHRKRSGVMYIREFVPGPINDIFLMDGGNLRKIISENPTFHQQLTKFVEISRRNKKLVVEGQLDLLGVNNLGVVGVPGKERLLLIDPHTRSSELTPERSQQINKRLEYLADMIEHNKSMVKLGR